ncbi:unnamed protein product [Rhodiola kirilowii]
MNCVVWNCRGLGRPRAVRATIDLIRSYKPAILGLIETKLEVGAWDKLRVKLGYSSCFAVSRNGLGGGLALLWNNEVEVSLRSYSKAHIDVCVRAEYQFRLTLFYGEPRVGRREDSWNLLRRLKEGAEDKWVVLGDFNEILHSNEMSGKRKRDKEQMRKFRRALVDCDLRDIGFTGPCFTYSNRRKGGEETRVRLDRVVANRNWLSRFPEASVENGWALHSDHRPLILSLQKVKAASMRKSDPSFRFEPMWLRDTSFKEDVRSIWRDVGGRYVDMKDKLWACGKELQRWNAQKFGNVQKKIKELKEYINALQSKPRTMMVVEREEEASRKLDEWLAREELLWRQRARTEWLKDGDKNTAFFKAKSTQRRDKKIINKLKTRDGKVVSSTEDILNEFADYFHGLFQAQTAMSENEWEEALNVVPRRVSDDMNRSLMEPYTVAEIRAALFQMHPTKAPGWDGFSALFYQRFWSIVKDDLCKEILSFLNGGELDRTWNETLLILVPKKKDAACVGEYRPISLCSVAVKIITKVLANRLKPHLPEIISPFQSAFIKGRLISDNILIAHEIVNAIRHKRQQQDGYLSLKLDMSKAFDRMEWPFLERMLLKLGFNQFWVSRVMSCVKTVSYRVKANGSISGCIIPGRGLRQGDPISPYLFIICQEWLSLRLIKEQERSSLVGVSFGRDIPPINHLFFADDCLLFMKADLHNLSVLKKVLFLYGRASGQLVNAQKSEICPSKNVDLIMQRLFGEYMKMNVVEKHTKYLGLPLVIGRSKTDVFRWIEDNMISKIQDWKTLLLSAAGKEALVKSCYLSVPLFAMTCYKVPKVLCDKLTSTAINFWWSSNSKERSIHWVSADILQKEKGRGGMGFRSLESLNVAMLMKQLWRFINQPDHLVSRIFKAKYFKDGQLLSARVKPNDSYAWRSLHGALELFSTGLEVVDDSVAWKWKVAGRNDFSVKSAYALVSNWWEAKRKQNGEVSNTEVLRKAWRNFWRTRLPERIKIMCWKVFHNALPVVANLKRRGCPVKLACCFCGFKEESVSHIFLECWWIKEFWKRLELEVPPGVWFTDITDMLWFFMTVGNVMELKKVMVGCWTVWYNRNLLAHGGPGMSMDWCCLRAKGALLQFDRRLLLGCDSRMVDPEAGDPIIVYCDGSWSPGEGVGGFAAVATCGVLILSCRANWCANCASVLDMECMALLAGLLLAKESGGGGAAVIKSDSADALWAIQTGYWQSEAFLQEAKVGLELLAQHKDWCLEFCFREDNAIADRLAKKARRDRWSWLSTDAVPRCVNQCVSSVCRLGGGRG